MPDALPDATRPNYPGLGPAPSYAKQAKRQGLPFPDKKNLQGSRGLT